MHRMGALVGSLLLALSPQVAADHLPLLPPSWSGGSYDEANHTINLTWLPPSNDTQTYTYHVYRDGVIVANTTQTWHVEEVAWSYAIFYVVAEDENGESPPSMPLLVENQAQGGGSGPGPLFEGGGLLDGFPFKCDVYSIVIYPHWPFVGISIFEYCIPIVGGMLHVSDPMRMVPPIE